MVLSIRISMIDKSRGGDVQALFCAGDKGEGYGEHAIRQNLKGKGAYILVICSIHGSRKRSMTRSASMTNPNLCPSFV